MVLRLLESFDHYGTSGNINGFLQRKWQTASPETGSASGDIAIVTGQANNSFGVSVSGSGTDSEVGFQHQFADQPGEIVVGCWWKIESFAGVGADSEAFIRLHADDLTNFHIGVEVIDSDVLVITRNGTVLATGSTVLTADKWYWLEIKATPANSGGTAELRINREVEISFTGDTSADNSTTFSGVGFFGSGVFYGTISYDDIYILDTTGTTNNDYLEDSSNNGGQTRIITLQPDGAGNSTQLSVSGAASNYLAVNDNPPDDDSSYVFTSTSGRDTYTVEDISDPISDVFGVANCIMNRKDGPANKRLSSIVRTGGVNFDSNGDTVLADYFTSCTILDQNPDTAADWTESDINSIEIGIVFFEPDALLSGIGTVTATGTLFTNPASLVGTGTVTAVGTSTGGDAEGAGGSSPPAGLPMGL